MSICLITGSAGLIGSEAARFFTKKGMTVVGIDNDMRSVFFGKEASTEPNLNKIKADLKHNYIHYNIDIRNIDSLKDIFNTYNSDIKLIIHTAAQPSHDWAAKEPFVDFSVNSIGTLNMLECMRQYCPESVFIYTSTNKVYGDTPNNLPLIELDTRWEIDQSHKFFKEGIDETMSIDQCKHSLFGVSKASGDLLVQEYGRYFGLKTTVFRGGCLTGPAHSGTELHGFLSYLVKCAITDKQYNIFGYKGKQVRDNIHSHDLITCFYEVFKNPNIGNVYNIGGGRFSNCSMMEAISICETLTNKSMQYKYTDTNRIGDHIWYISDTTKFKTDYPEWKQHYNIEDILTEIYHANK